MNEKWLVAIGFALLVLAWLLSFYHPPCARAVGIIGVVVLWRYHDLSIQHR